MRTIAMPAGDFVYPVHPQSADGRCNHCWQAGPSHMCADPSGDGLRRLCLPCARALRTGRKVELSVVQLAEMWEWLAHQHVNHRAAVAAGRRFEDTHMDELRICDALAAWTPAGMSPQLGWLLFEGLIEDLARFHRAEDPATVLDLAETGPDHDAETYASDLRGLVDDAVNKLIGRTR